MNTKELNSKLQRLPELSGDERQEVELALKTSAVDSQVKASNIRTAQQLGIKLLWLLCFAQIILMGAFSSYVYAAAKMKRGTIKSIDQNDVATVEEGTMLYRCYNVTNAVVDQEVDIDADLWDLEGVQIGCCCE